MTTTENHHIVLASRPTDGFRATDLRLETEAVVPLGAGQVRVEVDTLSVDAFIRTTLNADSYHQSVAVGGKVMALGVGRVLESADDSFAVGDTVFGPLGAQTISQVPAPFLQKVDVSTVPARSYLGALGLTTGLTAYFGIVDVGAVGPGDTVVVSGAAGAVGSFAGQIARLRGAAKVIGIAGGAAKCTFLVDELGFDAAIDYKNEVVADRLCDVAPNGIDVFFDNVGGGILDDVLFQISERARVVICGAISQYEHMESVSGPTNYLKLAERHARMEGFAVTHFTEHFPRAQADLMGWLTGGDLVVHEHVEHGIESFPMALQKLLTGGHTGKLLVQVNANAS